MPSLTYSFANILLLEDIVHKSPNLYSFHSSINGNLSERGKGIICIFAPKTT